MRNQATASRTDQRTQRLLREVKTLLRVPKGADSDQAAALRAHRMAMEATIEASKGRPSSMAWTRLVKTALALKRDLRKPSQEPAYRAAHRKTAGTTEGKPDGTWERRVEEAHRIHPGPASRSRRAASHPTADDSAIAAEPEEKPTVFPAETRRPRLSAEDADRLARIDAAIAKIEEALPRMVWRIQREKAEDELAALRMRRAQIDGTSRRESAAGILQFGYAVDGARNPANGLLTRAEWRRPGRWLD